MSECVICERPMEDTAYADSACAAQAAEKLRAIVELAPEARNVAYGLSRGAQGGASGKPGSRSPGNDDALDALGAIENTLGTWMRHVAEERGLKTPRAGTYSVYASSPDPIEFAALWITEHLEWLRHRPEVDEAFRDFADCASRVRFIVDGPSAKKYLGPCGAVVECEGLDVDDWPEGDCGDHAPHSSHESAPCEGDVYGPAGGSKGTCRTCGAQVDQGERRAWLDDQVLAHLADTPLRAKDIAHALRLSANTIRTWSHTVYDANGKVTRPAKLSSYWWDGERFVPWVEPREGEDVKARGPRLHYVGDVQELARKAADRRVEAEARRERRDTQEVAA